MSEDNDSFYAAFKAFKRDLVNDRGWVFSKSNKFISTVEYDEFLTRNGLGSNYFFIPCFYTIDSIDQYKSKLVSTSFNNTHGPRIYYSIFQLSKEIHLFANYVFLDNAYRVGYEIFCTDGKDFVDFMEDNSDYEWKPKEESLGFGFSPVRGSK